MHAASKANSKFSFERIAVRYQHSLHVGKWFRECHIALLRDSAVASHDKLISPGGVGAMQCALMGAEVEIGPNWRYRVECNSPLTRTLNKTVPKPQIN